VDSDSSIHWHNNNLSPAKQHYLVETINTIPLHGNVIVYFLVLKVKEQDNMGLVAKNTTLIGDLN